MGVFDRLFNRNKEEVEPYKPDDLYEKHDLASKIVNLVDKISRKNSFDSSIWNLRGKSVSYFENQSLAELKQLHSSLSRTLENLERRSQTSNRNYEAVEEAKWTGTKMKNQDDHDLDFSQRD